jgi:hypothetical protein
MPDFLSILPAAAQSKAACGACGTADVTVPHIHTTTLEQDAHGQWNSQLIFTLNCQRCQAVSYLVMDAITGQVKPVSLLDPE